MSPSVETDRIEQRLAALEIAVGRLALIGNASPAALKYPEPLATPLARECGAGLHQERFFSLLDAGEACIKYTGAIALALQSPQASRPLNAVFAQPLPLGRWIDLVQGFLHDQAASSTALGLCILRSFVRSNGKSTPATRYLLEEFVNVRNSVRGHGSSLPDGAYEPLMRRHADLLHDTLQACEYLSYPLVKVESVNPVSTPLEYDVRRLVGPPPLTSAVRIASDSRVPPGMVCVWDGRDSLVALGQTVMYVSCPVCNLEHTFFLEKWMGSFRYYHAYFGNHRMKVNDNTGEICGA